VQCGSIGYRYKKKKTKISKAVNNTANKTKKQAHNKIKTFLKTVAKVHIGPGIE
jgi:hypothetical protein